MSQFPSLSEMYKKTMVKNKFIKRRFTVTFIALLICVGGSLFEATEAEEMQANYQSENETIDNYSIRSLKELRWSEVPQGNEMIRNIKHDIYYLTSREQLYSCLQNPIYMLT